jgi:hypothetical protein
MSVDQYDEFTCTRKPTNVVGYSIYNKAQYRRVSCGVDNYHIDVKLSRKYCSDVKKAYPIISPANSRT